MLKPVNATDRGASSRPATTRPEDTGRRHESEGMTEENQSLLDGLPAARSWSEEVVRRYYAGCGDAGPKTTPDGAVDLAMLHRRLTEWHSGRTQDPTHLSDQQMVQELQSALIAAVTIGMAHSVELILLAFSNHPLVRVCAVSHPYVLATFLESMLKRLAGVEDPDPENRTGIRYPEKIIAALFNWNAVQPAIDTAARTPLARCLKVLATAVISAVRDGAERAETRALLQDLPPDAPAGPTKLTPGETLFINCLMCWLRNVGVDLIRQVVRSGGDGAVPATGPVAQSLLERFVRPVFLGSQVPGALPAAAISAQPALADGILPPPDAGPRPSRTDEILQQSHDLF